MDKDEDIKNNHEGETPTELAEEVARMLAAAEEEEIEDRPPEERYRDLELEQEIKAAKAAKMEAEQEMEEEIVRKEQEEAEIDGIRGNTRKEKTKAQVKADIKKIKSAQKKNKRSVEVKKALKYSSRTRHEQLLQAHKSKSPLMKAVGKAMEKLSAYKAYVIKRPGDQAGVFDNGKEASKKRHVKHDFDFGAQTVVEKFSTNVNGVEISGTVTSKVDNNAKGKLVHVDEPEITVDKAAVKGYDVSKSNLGNISHDAILNALNPDNKGIGK